MGVLLDPKKKDLFLTLYYIEDKKESGSSVFYFIRKEEDLNVWKKLGYKTEEEFLEIKKTAAKDVIVDDSKKINKLKTKWQKVNWKDQNDIYSKSIKIIPISDGSSRTEIDGIKYRDNRLKKNLVDWDLKDDDGNKIECTHENIDNLIPEVAEELISQYDSLINPEKKISDQ